MSVLVLLSMSIFLIYTIGVCVAFKGIPQSISDTFYKLENVHKGLGCLFTFFCWGVGFTLLPYLLEHDDSCPQIIRFLAVGGIALVGAAPYFKQYDRIAHFIGAFACIVFSQIWALCVCWWIPLLCWLTWVVCTFIYMCTHQTGILEKTFLRAKPMFWIEVVAFASVFMTIFVG